MSTFKFVPPSFTPFTKAANWSLLLLALIPLALYFQTTTFDFVDYDDLQYIKLNKNVISGLSLQNAGWAFGSLYASNWHPLTWISHMVDVQLFGMNAGGHHLVNVLLHTGNTVLLFIVLKRMSAAFWHCFIVAILFAVHPLHVESVAFVAERKDLLSTLFWMMTMLAYADYVRHCVFRRYLLVVLFYAAGLMAKPMLVTLPFILLIMDYWPLGRFQSFQIDELRRLLWEKIPLFVLSAVSCVVTIVAQGRGGSLMPVTFTDILHNMPNVLLAYVMYLWKMIIPAGLAVFYPVSEHVAWWKIVGSASVLVVITVIAVKERRRCRYLIAGWLWYVVSLVPVIGFIQVGRQAMADRYTYVPLIGIFIMVAWGIGDAVSRLQINKSIVAAGAAVIITALSIISWRQTGYWKNGVTLFEHAAKVTDNNPFTRHNLGVAQMARGRNPEAIFNFKMALHLNPGYKPAYLGLGQAYMETGNYSMAIQTYQDAISIYPGFVQAREGLSRAYTLSGR